MTRTAIKPVTCILEKKVRMMIGELQMKVIHSIHLYMNTSVNASKASLKKIAVVCSFIKFETTQISRSYATQLLKPINAILLSLRNIVLCQIDLKYLLL
jgi:hypothetical protein